MRMACKQFGRFYRLHVPNVTHARTREMPLCTLDCKTTMRMDQRSSTVEQPSAWRVRARQYRSRYRCHRVASRNCLLRYICTVTFSRRRYATHSQSLSSAKNLQASENVQRCVTEKVLPPINYELNWRHSVFFN